MKYVDGSDSWSSKSNSETIRGGMFPPEKINIGEGWLWEYRINGEGYTTHISKCYELKELIQTQNDLLAVFIVRESSKNSSKYGNSSSRYSGTEVFSVSLGLEIRRQIEGSSNSSTGKFDSYYLGTHNMTSLKVIERKDR